MEEAKEIEDDQVENTPAKKPSDPNLNIADLPIDSDQSPEPFNDNENFCPCVTIPNDSDPSNIASPNDSSLLQQPNDGDQTTDGSQNVSAADGDLQQDAIAADGELQSSTQDSITMDDNLQQDLNAEMQPDSQNLSAMGEELQQDKQASSALDDDLQPDCQDQNAIETAIQQNNQDLDEDGGSSQDNQNFISALQPNGQDLDAAMQRDGQDESGADSDIQDESQELNVTNDIARDNQDLSSKDGAMRQHTDDQSANDATVQQDDPDASNMDGMLLQDSQDSCDETEKLQQDDQNQNDESDEMRSTKGSQYGGAMGSETSARQPNLDDDSLTMEQGQDISSLRDTGAEVLNDGQNLDQAAEGPDALNFGSAQTGAQEAHSLDCANDAQDLELMQDQDLRKPGDEGQSSADAGVAMNGAKEVTDGSANDARADDAINEPISKNDDDARVTDDEELLADSNAPVDAGDQEDANLGAADNDGSSPLIIEGPPSIGPDALEEEDTTQQRNDQPQGFQGQEIDAGIEAQQDEEEKMLNGMADATNDNDGGTLSSADPEIPLGDSSNRDKDAVDVTMSSLQNDATDAADPSQAPIATDATANEDSLDTPDASSSLDAALDAEDGPLADAAADVAADATDVETDAAAAVAAAAADTMQSEIVNSAVEGEMNQTATDDGALSQAQANEGIDSQQDQSAANPEFSTSATGSAGLSANQAQDVAFSSVHSMQTPSTTGMRNSGGSGGTRPPPMETIKEGAIPGTSGPSKGVENRCGECGEELGRDDQRTIYKQIAYHPRCFVCAECKSEKLSGLNGFYVNGGRRYCVECYNKNVAERCTGCGEAILEGGVRHRSRPFHHKCFKCAGCEMVLGRTPFVFREMRTLCLSCYADKFAEKCTKCEKRIQPGEQYLQVEGKRFHDDCLVCDICNDQLQDNPFVQDGTRNVCVNCSTNGFVSHKLKSGSAETPAPEETKAEPTPRKSTKADSSSGMDLKDWISRPSTNHDPNDSESNKNSAAFPSPTNGDAAASDAQMTTNAADREDGEAMGLDSLRDQDLGLGASGRRASSKAPSPADYSSERNSVRSSRENHSFASAVENAAMLAGSADQRDNEAPSRGSALVQGRESKICTASTTRPSNQPN